MKFKRRWVYGPQNPMSVVEAVEYVLSLDDLPRGQLEAQERKQETLAGMVAWLIHALAAKGVLTAADMPLLLNGVELVE